ncbi:MAG: transcriptional regulator [Blastocatellales bacterium]
MNIPDLQHRSFVVLAALSDGRERSFDDIRTAVGWESTRANFTQTATRLHRAGLVEREHKSASGVRTLFRITTAGRRAYREAIDFYLFIARKHA